MKIQTETLKIAHTINFRGLLEAVANLGSKLNNNLPQSEAQQIADIYSKISSNLQILQNIKEKQDDGDFSFSMNEKTVELPNLKRKTDGVIGTISNLDISDKHLLNKLRSILSEISILSRNAEGKQISNYIVPKAYQSNSGSPFQKYTFKQGNDIIISVTVPTFEEEIFRLYKVINFPIIKNKNIVNLQNAFRYLIISKTRYFAVSEDLRDLESIDGFLIYNDKEGNLKYNLNNSPCLYNMFNEKSVESCEFKSNFTNIEIFEKLDSNRFLFAIRDDTFYTFRCGMRNNYGQKEVIQGTGILYLENLCEFKTSVNSLKAVQEDGVFHGKDRYFLNLDHYLNKTLTSYLQPIPKILPMEKFNSDFSKLDKLFEKLDKLLKEQDDLLKNLIEEIPTDEPIIFVNSTEETS